MWENTEEALQSLEFKSGLTSRINTSQAGIVFNNMVDFMESIKSDLNTSEEIEKVRQALKKDFLNHLEEIKKFVEDVW